MNIKIIGIEIKDYIKMSVALSKAYELIIEIAG